MSSPNGTHETKIVFKGEGFMGMPCHGACKDCEWEGPERQNVVAAHGDTTAHAQENIKLPVRRFPYVMKHQPRQERVR